MKKMRKKNKILLIIALVIAAVSCKKEEYIFDQSPDERLNETLAGYQAALTSSPAGWKAVLQPALGGAYNFFFQFNNDNRVFMFADIDTATAHTKRESSYRLKALQQPSLIFDTYSYLHILADPDGSKNGGINGVGLASDFEFAFQSASEDSIVLIGRQNKTKLKLEKATQEELDAWQNGTWLNILNFLNIQKIEHYFKRLSLGGATYEIEVDPVSRLIKFQWISGGSLQTLTTGYFLNSQGLMLETPVVNGSQTIDRLAGFSWNNVTKTLQLTAAGTTGNITGATAPLRADTQAPRRWWQEGVTQDSYWYSRNGFRSSSSPDLFNMRSLNRYYYLVYWPVYGENGENDLFGPVFINSAEDGLELLYGAAPDIPTFTADGRIVFDNLGFYGPYPSTGPAYQSLQQLLIPEGYYLVQTASGYDMVSAADARTWISWVPTW